MRNKIFLILTLILCFVLPAGCNNHEESPYTGFLELPAFEIWGKEIYDAIVVNTKSDDELLQEGYNEEQISQFREINIDDEIKRMATYSADMLGTTVQNSIIFKQYVDAFYGEDISYYLVSDLVLLSNDELQEFFGYSEEECEKMRKFNEASLNPDEYTDEELMNLGFSQTEIESLRNQQK